MCGIIGCVTREEVSPGRFAAARDLMRHRGPDDAGYLGQAPVYLGARRLAILDLSQAGHQPMRTPDGRLAVAFNGELYNFPELRRQLEGRFAFRSHSDTEVLLHGYRAWGWDGLLRRIDGMFAIALWDADTRRLHLGRDRVGKKPLYYCQRGPELYFASTLAALRALLPWRPDLDPRAIDAYLVYQAVPAPMTVFAGVRHLEPGHELRFTVDTGELAEGCFWDVSYGEKLDISEGEALAELDRLLRIAVRRRQLADVAVGSFLSGGVDSGLITALLAEESSGPVEAITLGFPEPEYDERPYARAVAARLGVHLHEIELPADGLQRLPAILAQYGQPIGDVSIVPTYLVAEEARRHVTVVLNGDGGDELFGGYARPVVAKAAAMYRIALPPAARRALAGTAGLLPRRPGMLVRAGGVGAHEAFTYDRGLRGERGRAYDPRFLAALGDWDPDDLYGRIWNRAVAADDVDRALYGDFKTYLPDQLLVKMDVATMAHSVEARSPLLDTALVEFAARLPTRLRLPGWTTKHLLKELARRHLPGAAVRRRKQGFVMPAPRWLAADAARHVRASLLSGSSLVRWYLRRGWLEGLAPGRGGRSRHQDDMLWTVWMLELWLRLQSGALAPDDPLDAVLGGEPVRPRSSGARRRPVAAGEPAPRPRLRSLQVGMEWFPETPGGLNRMYYQLLRHLPGEGVEAEGLVQSMTERAEGEGWSARALTAAPWAPAALRWGQQGRDLRETLRRGDYDLVASHFAPAIWPALGALADRPLVVHFHGPWALEGRAEGWSAAKAAVARRIERGAYARADRLIVLSRAFGRIAVERYGVCEERVRVVPGGVETDRFRPRVGRAEARARLGWPASRPVLLSVRRLVRRMGLENLLAALAAVRGSIPDLWLGIVGSGPLRAELEQRVRELGLQGSVRLLGRLPDELLPLAYRAADCSVVPSAALEGFCLSAVESLAAGTPVIATPVGGLPEVLAGLAPELVCPGSDPGALGDHLRAALRGELPLPPEAACVHYARERFAWEAVARGVRQVYLEAAG